MQFVFQNVRKKYFNLRYFVIINTCRTLLSRISSDLGTLFMHLFNIPIRIIKHYILFIRKQTRYPEVDLNEPIKIKNPQKLAPANFTES